MEIWRVGLYMDIRYLRGHSNHKCLIIILSERKDFDPVSFLSVQGLDKH